MDYINEIKKLPQEIQDILISPFGAKINREMINKYNLDKKSAGVIVDIVNDIYLKKLNLVNLKEKIINIISLPPDRVQSLCLDLAGLKLLIADDYFKGIVKDFILANRGDLATYQAKAQEWKEAIKREQEIYISETAEPKYESKLVNLNDDEEDPALINQEKIDAVSLFKEDVINALKLGPDSSEMTAIYNEFLIDLIKDDENFRKSLETSLYNNQELVVPEKIIVNGSEVKASVANWIKDFISQNGSEMFNNVVLVKYLSDNPNVKKLKDADREIVKKVLKLYRNLVFFPDSMENVPLEEWEIFPVDQTQALATIGPRKGGKILNVLDENNQEAVEAKIAEPEIDNQVSQSIDPAPVQKEPSELDQLESLLQKYSPGSFEYKTIQQEIKRLKRLGQK
ncbi:MAG: hypothetical protein WC441_00420 [Patescibacteria group bacterium]